MKSFLKPSLLALVCAALAGCGDKPASQPSTPEAPKGAAVEVKPAADTAASDAKAAAEKAAAEAKLAADKAAAEAKAAAEKAASDAKLAAEKAALEKAAAEAKAQTAAAVSKVTEIITTARGQANEQKYAEALVTLQQLSGTKLSLDQQGLVDAIKQEAQKRAAEAAAKKATEEAAKAVGNLFKK